MYIHIYTPLDLTQPLQNLISLEDDKILSFWVKVLTLSDINSPWKNCEVPLMEDTPQLHPMINMDVPVGS